MRTIAIVSTTGGAGRSTVTAALASLLTGRGHAVLALECDPRNVLGFHFGMRLPARDGLSGHLGTSPSGAWAEAGQRSDDGVLFVPWGEPRQDDPTRALLHAGPEWLRGLLAQVDLPARGVALIDTAPWPSAHASQAITAADLVLALMPAQPEVCLTLRRLGDVLATLGRPCIYVATRLQPARQLHADIVTMLHATLGQALLPYHVHEDSGVAEAFAQGQSFCRSTPHSQAAHDLNGLASWLSAWIDANPQGAQP